MAEESVFRGTLTFFERLGVYDVILPFLLTFTIFYAVLERTKVLGTEKIEGEESPKKNLNAMVAFVVAFLVVASTKMVAIISEALPNILLLVLVSISFLLLIGTFAYKEKDEVILDGGWKTFLMVIMFIGVVLIFAHAIPAENGEPWLEYAWDYVTDNYDSTAVSAIVMIILLVGVMVWITAPPKKKTEKKKE